ncbi:hypothetical protein L209DRAFT_614331 [Thermothelomyces heterothallicus CBS 203.75]
MAGQVATSGRQPQILNDIGARAPCFPICSARGLWQNEARTQSDILRGSIEARFRWFRRPNHGTQKTQGLPLRCDGERKPPHTRPCPSTSMTPLDARTRLGHGETCSSESQHTLQSANSAYSFHHGVEFISGKASRIFSAQFSDCA